MNNELNKKNEVNIFLVLLIGILFFIIGFLVAYIIISNNKDNKSTETTEQKIDVQKQQEEKYVTYSKLQTITLNDDSKWVVIKDSDEKSDYVTVISTISYAQYADENDQNISWIADSTNDKKLFKNTYGDFMTESNKEYKDSSFPKILEKIKSTYNFKLKQVNGYDIRLLTLEDVKELDDNWKYEYDGYTYTGNKDLSVIESTLMMSSTKCTEGKCNKLYNTYPMNSNVSVINSYSLGYPDIKPVINVYKSEIKN